MWRVITRTLRTNQPVLAGPCILFHPFTGIFKLHFINYLVQLHVLSLPAGQVNAGLLWSCSV